MIASLRGVLVALEPVALVEVGGVGFAVQVSARTAAMLPEVGQEISLVTYLHVREDQLSLYGFATSAERAFFLLLLGVGGIGPRSALTLLSSAPIEEFQRAIVDGDEKYLVRLPGLGKKTAARLVVELQGKIQVTDLRSAAHVESRHLLDEAALALGSLGLTPRSARDAISKVEITRLPQPLRVEDIVKAALE